MFDRGAGDPPSGATAERAGVLSARLAELESLTEERRRLDHRESLLLADASVAEEIVVEHGHSVAGWHADRAKVATKAAHVRVRVADRLHHRYHELARALGEGKVGWNHVTVFDRAANPRVRDAMVELLPGIVELARVATFDRWAAEVRGMARLLDDDGGYDPAEDAANNNLRLTDVGGGYTQVSGRLVGELALTITALIDAETDRVLTRYRRDEEEAGEGEIPSRARAAAEALGEMCERAAGTPDGEGRMPESEIIVSYDVGTGDVADADGAHLSVSMLRWLVAASLMRPLEVSESGDPLRMGRALRYANREQRRALAVRDGGCIFPGCSRPAHWCDAHHIDEWDHGGPTDIENMALLCRHHHRVTHRPGWVMSRRTDLSDATTADGPDIADGQVMFRWRTPSGRVIYSQRHHERRLSDVA